jgi:hypothetical protein
MFRSRPSQGDAAKRVQPMGSVQRTPPLQETGLMKAITAHLTVQ